MVYYKLEQHLLKLKYTWKISRNSSDSKINFLIRISDDFHQGFGEVAPNVRYGESVELIKHQFDVLTKNGLSEIDNLSSLNNLLIHSPVCNSLRFGVESAFVHFWCAKENKTVYEYFNLSKPNVIQTAFSMPIMPIEELCAFYLKYDLARFKHLKLKVNAENAIDAFKEISQVAQQPIMVDGNETWQNPDEVLKYIETLSTNKLLFIEQPMPAIEIEAYRYLKTKSSIEIIADESVTNNADMNELKYQFHGINMKLMKAGGYQKGIEILKSARENGLKTMIGCMVETSIGIASAMNLCANIDYIDLDGFLIIENEPFKIINEQEGYLKFAKPNPHI